MPSRRVFVWFVTAVVGVAWSIAAPLQPAIAAEPCTPDEGYSHCVTFTEPSETGEVFTVPERVSSVSVSLFGAGGGKSHFEAVPGSGGRTTALVSGLTSGDQFWVSVGGSDGTGGGGPTGDSALGFPAGNGGGLSGLWAGAPFDSAPVLIAGGGAGAPSSVREDSVKTAGGSGGGSEGVSGLLWTGEASDAAGQGGTQTAGGAGGSHIEVEFQGFPGSKYRGGQGGYDNIYPGGGGGGGYFGGGGGAGAGLTTTDAGGGGGSGYVAESVGSWTVTDATTSVGAGSFGLADGRVWIQWNVDPVKPTPTKTPTVTPTATPVPPVVLPELVPGQQQSPLRALPVTG